MYRIIRNDLLAPNLHRLVVLAPRVAKARQPGQFVIIRGDGRGERIPLTIGDADPVAGTITLFIQAVGLSTCQIASTPVDGYLNDVAGPLGKPTHFGNWDRVVCVGGGVGTAVLFPLVKALSESGKRITTIIGGRSDRYIILADELGEFSEQAIITTEDGSRGRRGFVTDALIEMLDGPHQRPDAIFAIGPVPMMRAVAEMTRPYGIETIVSLNPVMIDGTGMCGGCRVMVGGEMKFACVDGPEFDGHQVDFAGLSDRLTTYRNHEEVMRHRSTECFLTSGASR
jgi:ferredoxin--NADP+ reductase